MDVFFLFENHALFFGKSLVALHLNLNIK